uniref:Uncharacterized protein n=2 Tax=Caenorhabditis japonica TaxID=281687 RepID=A0A8R1DU73_CAEJA
MISERMHPEDSVAWAHATLRVSTVYLQTFFLSMLFLTIGLCFFSTEFIVAPDNYSLLTHSYRSDYTNETTITFDEVMSLDPQHPLYIIMTRDFFRYSFGTIYNNHCNLFPYPKGFNLPSILRRMTFSASAQVSMRTAILVSITIRMVAILCRIADILSQYPSKQRQIRSLSCLCWAADIVTSVMAMLLTCLHDGVDSKAMGFLVHYSLPLFAISFFVSASLYTMLEYYDINRKSSRVLERMICLTLFGLCFPIVCRDYLSFLISKPCLYHVDWKTGVCEYTCITSIAAFYLTKVEDFTKMEFVLSTEKVETMCCMYYIDFPDYMPAMLHDFGKVTEQKKTVEENRL